MFFSLDVQEYRVAGFSEVALDVVASEAVEAAEAHVQPGFCLLMLEILIIIADIT